MTTVSLRRSPQELARLGGEIFDLHIKPSLVADDDGKFVAIDVNSGDHEINEDDYAAISRLRARKPGAEVWLIRAGRKTAYRIGCLR
jgi:hypothetical protein